ncbi:uncharacterized protein LOC124939246 [Impatiens glandulifera]|uniref:uncharacterized protein LOC124939246 n=1 Tax=Impatiens glandulifera TaxID=253017 RepID=UPI001FB12D4E|nr:uncharacterized protein LOC124939246 [Impatiens glandulifera]
MDIMYKILYDNMFNYIMSCNSAKEIWERLTQLCEGNEQIKENKFMVVTQQFDNIKMRPEETMTEFDGRFNKIIITLSTLGHFKSECKKPKRDKNKKDKKESKALMMTDSKTKRGQSDSDDSSSTHSDDEEPGNAVIQQISVLRPSRCKSSLGFNNASPDQSSKKLNPVKDKLKTISFVRGSLTDNGTNPSCKNLTLKDEIIYVPPTIRCLEESIWYLDSECSRHMSGDRRLLIEIMDFSGPKITFGDNNNGKTMGKDKVCPACQLGKQSKLSFKSKGKSQSNRITTSKFSIFTGSGAFEKFLNRSKHVEKQLVHPLPQAAKVDHQTLVLEWVLGHMV